MSTTKAKEVNAQTAGRLLEQLRSKKPLARAEAIRALAEIEGPEVSASVIGMLEDPSPTVRSAVAECLGRMGRGEAVQPLLSKLSDRSVEVRVRAAESLGILLEGEGSPPALIQRLRDPNELVRIEVAESLGAIGDREALAALWEALDDRSPLVRSYVAGAIGSLGNEEDAARLEERMRREKSDTALVGFYQALYILGHCGVLTDLLGLLQSGDYRVRCAAANVLSNVVASRSTAPLIMNSLRRALRKEITIAARSSIRACLRTLSSRHDIVGARGSVRGGRRASSS